MVCERLKQHLKRSAAGFRWLESLLSALVLGFVDGVASLVRNKASPWVWWLQCRPLGAGFMVYRVFVAFSRSEGKFSTAIPKTSGTSPSMPLVPVNESSKGWA